MTIQKVGEQHIDEIVRIHRACVRESNAKVYPPAVIKEWLNQISEENVLSQLNNSQWLVALDEDKVVGFCQFNLEDQELYQINVDPGEQGKGIGRKLYLEIESQFHAENKNKMMLNATLNAVSFYKSLGYKKIKDLKFRLDHEEVEMVEMEKSL